MSALWWWVLAACATAYLIKLAGYQLPASVLQRPWVGELATTMTVGLLASLTVLNTVASGRALHADARLVALLAGAIALRLRAPYLVVVLVGAASAAIGRLLGLS